MAAGPSSQPLRPRYTYVENAEPTGGSAIDSVRRQLQPYFSDPRLEPSSLWKLRQRELEIGLGISPTELVKAGLDIVQIWERRDPQSIKRAMIQSWNNRDFSILNFIAGLRVSACSPFAHRVPLRIVLADCLDRGVETFEAGALSHLKSKIRALLLSAGPDLITIWNRRSKDEQAAIRQLIEFLLTNLLPTGLAADGKSLVLLWPHEASLKATVRMTLAESTWAEITRGTAIFAVITNECLASETSTHNPHGACTISNFRLRGVKTSFVKAQPRSTILGLRCDSLPASTPRANQLVFQPGRRYLLQSGKGYLKLDPDGAIRCSQLPWIWRPSFRWWGQRASDPRSRMRSLLKMEMVREIMTGDELDSQEVIVL
ncbi:hypothetical protein Dda_1941 [Drechslerella dactyloides]|uniref:Uncharacterized protein n=1 Tax=Drechslerella dactyloides TaxID=74499 RepID=A0AAD6NNH2_DREDA|nr:hypothetical protein Dda_1941 [Drechslerella dactyloides]